MKRFLTLFLTLVMALGLAACADRMASPAETAVPTEAVEESEMPGVTPSAEPSPEMTDDALAVSDVLDAIRDYHPDTAGSGVMCYAAAARVLTFVRETERSADELRRDAEDYLSRLSDDEREQFARQYDDVIDLAQRIAKGDVEQSELDSALSDAGVDMEPIDPVSDAHEKLADFAEAVKNLLR